MDAFSFVFSLFGLLLGLALAEVLGGFGNALQSRKKVRIGWLTSLLGVVVAFDLTSFWTFAWQVRDRLPPHYLVLLYGLVVTGIYYLAARLVFPHDRDEWPDYDTYYFAHKKWVIGGVVLCNLLVIAGQEALGFNAFRLQVDQVTNAIFYGLAIAAMLVRGRRANIVLLAVLALLYPFAGVYSFIATCGGACLR